jgi:hypothetical protein
MFFSDGRFPVVQTPLSGWYSGVPEETLTVVDVTIGETALILSSGIENLPTPSKNIYLGLVF